MYFNYALQMRSKYLKLFILKSLPKIVGGQKNYFFLHSFYKTLKTLVYDQSITVIKIKNIQQNYHDYEVYYLK